MIRVDSRFAPKQWETSLQSNGISHWLGVNLESALMMVSHICEQWSVLTTLQELLSRHLTANVSVTKAHVWVECAGNNKGSKSPLFHGWIIVNVGANIDGHHGKIVADSSLNPERSNNEATVGGRPGCGREINGQPSINQLES